jgi:hypothetical protein
MIDTLFVLALLILPINAFVVTLFLLSNVYPDPTTAMPSAVEAAMLILPPWWQVASGLLRQAQLIFLCNPLVQLGQMLVPIFILTIVTLRKPPGIVYNTVWSILASWGRMINHKLADAEGVAWHRGSASPQGGDAKGADEPKERE